MNWKKETNPVHIFKNLCDRWVCVYKANNEHYADQYVRHMQRHKYGKVVKGRKFLREITTGVDFEKNEIFSKWFLCQA